MPVISHLQEAVKRFECLGDKCPNTCCVGWQMQVDEATFQRYQTQYQFMLDAVETGPSGGRIMCKSKETGQCTKLDNGLCSVHAAYGTDALGDACYFYPRSTRRLGDYTIMTGALSCPEMARLLMVEQAQEYAPANPPRLPDQVHDYLPASLTAAKAWQVHQALTDPIAQSDLPAECLVLHLLAVVQGMQTIPEEQWDEAAPFYWRMAPGRMVEARPDAQDPLNLLLSLVALFHMSQQVVAVPLQQMMARMSEALKVEIDWALPALRHTAQTAQAAQDISKAWNDHAQLIAAALLRRWLQAQLASCLFPFSGFGHTLEQRVVVFGVRLATLKLALCSRLVARQLPLNVDDILEDAHVLSRFMDHLAEPTMSLNVYQDFGWMRIARLRSLLGI